MSSFKCSQCGQIHEGWPALAFDCPDRYHSLSEEEKTNNAELTEDFCTIRYEGQIDRFIRVVLKQKVKERILDLLVYVCSFSVLG